MERIGIYDARARLSDLVQRVQAGEEVVLTRRGEAVARLIPEGGRGKRKRAPAVKHIQALSERLNLKISRAELYAGIAQGRDSWRCN